MKRSIQEAILGLGPARWAIALFMLCRGSLSLRAGNLYRGLLDLCWIPRVANVPSLVRLARPQIFSAVETLRRDNSNALVASYRSDTASVACAEVYSLAGGTHDMFRDLIVLKSPRPGEKGVILLKYARTFDGVVALFDLERLMERYHFVLEPCWAGYCHPSTLMYVAKDNPVFVQCFTEEDHRFVVDVGAPLVAMRQGPADWVDADLFRPPPVVEKSYDLVMVANWSPQKRHALLFEALEQIRDRDTRALLIGFPWANRTAADVKREAATIRNPRVHVEVIEQVPQAELAAHVSQCKAFVFLNRKEGDNKALVEAMFANVPAIVYDETIGGARSRINPETGILTSDEALANSIVFMLDHHRDFRPRAWALEHSGSAIATQQLNETIRDTVIGGGGRYTESIVEKVNSPNLAYKDPRVRARFQSDYDFILTCRRGTSEVERGAVA
jgi:glycosyltransferase involved in cell wall biosynthesis